MPVTVLSLFSGIGGLDLACHAAGWETVGLVEYDPHLQAFLAQRFPGVPIWGDVREFTAASFRERTGLERPDVVAGSPPCQPFSIAGRRKGCSDERDMWPEFVRVVRGLRPRAVLAENVRGMLIASGPGGNSLGLVLGDLAALGYVGAVGTCGADEAAGFPMLGDRVWIYGVRGDVGKAVPQPVRRQMDERGGVPRTDQEEGHTGGRATADPGGDMAQADSSRGPR